MGLLKSLRGNHHHGITDIDQDLWFAASYFEAVHQEMQFGFQPLQRYPFELLMSPTQPKRIQFQKLASVLYLLLLTTQYVVHIVGFTINPSEGQKQNIGESIPQVLGVGSVKIL